MDEKPGDKAFKIRHKIIIPIIIVIVLVVDNSFGLGLVPKLVTRFCYNSQNPSQVNSQCVLCNYYLFDQTLLGCTGSSALSINITAAQAFCVISNCLGQVRQSPVFLGRKKRSEDSIQYNNQPNEEHKSLENTIGNDYTFEDKTLLNDGNKDSIQMVYKYNSNEQFIVAKEVEALIIDLPEIEDESTISI